MRNVKPTATAFCDGACSPNPGHGAWGCVLISDGRTYRGCGYIGKSTNNEAEIIAVQKCLIKAQKLGVRSLIIYSDSKLAVNMISGRWKGKCLRLRSLARQTKQAGRFLTFFRLKFIPREKNTEADSLSQKGLCRRTSRKRPQLRLFCSA